MKFVLAIVIATAAACGGDTTTAPGDPFTGRWALTDSLDTSAAWRPVTGGTLTLGADHRFTLDLPPSTRARQEGDWDTSTATQNGSATTILELQANPAWLGVQTQVGGNPRLVISRGGGFPQYAFVKQ
jgi:hypothetical protein